MCIGVCACASAYARAESSVGAGIPARRGCVQEALSAVYGSADVGECADDYVAGCGCAVSGAIFLWSGIPVRNTSGSCHCVEGCVCGNGVCNGAVDSYSSAS